MKDQARRFSVICDSDGRIEKVLDDPAGIFSRDLPGILFFSKAVHGDLEKMLNFFVEVKTKQNAIGWEISLFTEEGPVLFSFFGGLIGDRIGITAATNANGARQMFNDLNGINNEQVNIIRSVTKENARLKAEKQNDGINQLDELSRLNNELVNIQRELAKKNKELDYLNKLKNQFLGIAAHDLRSPLGVILGYSELLRDEASSLSSEEQNDLAARIHKTGKFMLGLINDLLDIANIESGNLELHLSKEDLAAVIQTNIEMNALYARSKNIEIEFAIPSDPVEVMIDRPKIDQAITNYLTNALKYSHPGSQVTVILETRDNSAYLCVRDHGQGIRENELNKLFKAFQRTSTLSTGGEKSTGLGLSIVKKIVEAHGGETGVRSIFGKGSDFYFTLPLFREA
jgi:signal transduction histidine kinase